MCILLGWHYLSREPWQLSGGIISAMAVESLVLGICLRVVLFLQDAIFHAFNDPLTMSIGGEAQGGAWVSSGRESTRNCCSG